MSFIKGITKGNPIKTIVKAVVKNTPNPVKVTADGTKIFVDVAKTIYIGPIDALASSLSPDAAKFFDEVNEIILKAQKYLAQGIIFTNPDIILTQLLTTVVKQAVSDKEEDKQSFAQHPFKEVWMWDMQIGHRYMTYREYDPTKKDNPDEACSRDIKYLDLTKVSPQFSTTENGEAYMVFGGVKRYVRCRVVHEASDPSPINDIPVDYKERIGIITGFDYDKGAGSLQLVKIMEDAILLTEAKQTIPPSAILFDLPGIKRAYAWEDPTKPEQEIELTDIFTRA